MYNLAIFASGSGTNAENIAKVFAAGSRVRVAIVLTNRRNAGVIARMEKLDIPVEYVPNSVWDNNPQEVVRLLKSHDIDLIVLAGFMHYVAPAITAAYAGRIVNIHPSLLPAYGGKGMYGHYVHEAVVAAGEKKSGVTVHYVTDEMDKGEIVMQQSIEVFPDDTPESLEARIHPVEYELYPRAIVKALTDIKERSKMPPAPDESTPVAAAAADSDANADTVIEATLGIPEPENTQNICETPKPEIPEPEIPKPEARQTPASPQAGPATPPPLDRRWADVLGVPIPENRASESPVAQAPAHPSNSPQQFGQPANPGVNPQPAFQAGLNGQSSVPAEPCPPSYLLWAILATILCNFIAGIIAIVFASKVSSAYYAGNLEGAKRASDRAQIWIIVSIVVGIIVNSLYMPLMMLLA